MKTRLLCLMTAIKYCIASKMRILTWSIHPSALLGKGCIIKRGSIVSEGDTLDNFVEIYRHVILGKNVKIGAYSSINDSTVIECGSIGRFCSIGVDVIIGLGTHPLNSFTSSTLARKLMCSQRSERCKFVPPRPPIIEDDVWIGSRAMIMRGITIHTGAVIGAGAVVTKDVPAYAIVAGVPARIIRYRFDESIQKRILPIWNHSNVDTELLKELIASGDSFTELLKNEADYNNVIRSEYS